MPTAQRGWMEVPRRKQFKAMPWSINVIPKIRYIFKGTSVLDLSGSKVIGLNVKQKIKRRILGLVIGLEVLTVKHIQGAFFNCSSPFSVPKWKNLLSQRGAFLHWKFREKLVLVGCNLFFILVLKIRRNSKKHPVYFCKHNTSTQTSSAGGTWVLLWLASSCAVAKTSLQVAHLCRCLVACCRTTGWAGLGCWGGSRCWLGEVRWVSKWVFMVGRSVNSSPQLPHFHL